MEINWYSMSTYPERFYSKTGLSYFMCLGNGLSELRKASALVATAVDMDSSLSSVQKRCLSAPHRALRTERRCPGGYCIRNRNPHPHPTPEIRTVEYKFKKKQIQYKILKTKYYCAANKLFQQ